MMKKQLIPALFGMAGGFLSFLVLALVFKVFPDSFLGQGQPDPDFPTLPASFASVSLEEMDSLNANFVKASAVSTQSVVYIKTRSQQQSYSWYDWYFGGGNQQVSGSGSGVIYTTDGYIITNHHVIGEADQIEVIFQKKSYEAKVIGADPSTDLAILKIEGDKKFPVVAIGSSRTLQVGEWVLAVGNPFNLTSTVTAGIVSAKGRDIGIVNDKFPLESFIQTDAAINPGNSGGAMINLRGQLVGINTAIISKTGYYTGYGFAVPVDIVVKVVNDLIKFGKVQKAFTGAEVKTVDYSTAHDYDITDEGGVVVTHVMTSGAFESAGIKEGDIITHIDGNPVGEKSQFEEEINIRNPGNKIRVKIRRDGDEMEKSITLLNEDGNTGIIQSKAVESSSLGASFEPISKLEEEMHHTPHGVKILAVRSGFIRDAGIPDGFIITTINGEIVDTAEKAIQYLEGSRGRVVIEGINKNGGRGYFSFFTR